MANNKIQVKRTSTSGRTPNTTNSGNAQYISAGELALNMADGILYTSNGSALISVGANQENLSITNSLALDNDRQLRFKTVNTSAYSFFVQQSDDNFVFYTTNTSYSPRAVWASYANTTNSSFDILSPLKVSGGIVANGSFGSAGQSLFSSGSGVYWGTGAGTGTVTQVDSGNGLTGGPITSNGTLSVKANTGIVANTSGLFVNSSYIATLDANNTSYLGGVAAADYQLESGLAANVATLAANAATYLNGKTESNLNVNNALTANASTYLNGKLEAGLNVNNSLTSNNASYLGGTAAANFVQNTDSRTLSGNLVFSGANTTFSNKVTINGALNANDVTVAGNLVVSGTVTTVNTATLDVKDVNITVAKGAANSLLADGGGITVDGASATWNYNDATASWVSNIPIRIGTSTTNVSINTTAFSGTSNNSTYAFGKTEGNLNVNNALTANNSSYLGGTLAASYVQNTDSRTLSGNLVISGTYFNPSANTILLGNSISRWVVSANSGDFSSTVNAVTSVNSALLTVGTNFVANTTGAYHTGTMNAASLTVGSSFIANSTAIVGTGYANITTSVNSALLSVGALFTANSTLVNAAAINVTNQVNAATLYATTSANVGSLVRANTTAYLISSNSTVNSILTATSITFANTTATPFVANVTGLYHTGLVNAASFNTSGVTANTSGIYPASNTVGDFLGNTIARWEVYATNAFFAGAVSGITTLAAGNSTITGFVNATTVAAGANVYMNATHVFVSTNSTMNTVITANQITLNGANVMTTATTLKVYYSNGTLAFP